MHTRALGIGIQGMIPGSEARTRDGVRKAKDMSGDRAILEGYVKLALAIDRHFEGFVDAYFGPEEWREESVRNDAEPLPILAKRGEELIKALEQSDGLNDQRVQFLSAQVQAMSAMVQILMGKEMPVKSEASALYDIEVEWTDEATFHEAHELLDEALPPGGNLHERMEKRRAQLRLEEEQIEPLIMLALEEVQKRTRHLFELPPGEEVEITFVRDKPWAGYNWYLGNLRSRIEINIDVPFYLNSVLEYVAHEAYPGHHTELSMKEHTLVNSQGRIEHSIIPLNVPAATVSEGIATRGLLALASEDEWDAWSARVLQPAAEKTDLDPEKLKLLRRAWIILSGVSNNANFLLHERGKSKEEVAQYLVKHGLFSEEQAKHAVRFKMTPQFRTYSFVYSHGRNLVDELLESVDDKLHTFSRLLLEPLTPGLIRRWIASERESE